MNIETYWDDISLQYVAYNSDNYCACVDCHDYLGYGTTKQEAIEEYLEVVDFNGSR